MESVGASWADPKGQVYRYVGSDQFEIEDDRCVIGPNVQVSIDTMANRANAAVFFDSLVRSANQGVAPLATPSPVTELGDRAMQLPGWVFVLKDNKVLSVTVQITPPDGFAPPAEVLRLAMAAFGRLG